MKMLSSQIDNYDDQYMHCTTSIRSVLRFVV